MSETIKAAMFVYSSQTESLIFDQSKNEGVCAGDSGGPGLRFFDGTLKIVGVAQSVRVKEISEEACGYAVRYTNVSYYKNWLIKNFNELSNSDSQVRRRAEALFN